MKSSQQLHFVRHKIDVSSVLAWHLDGPRPGVENTADDGAMLKFHGWLLYEPIYRATIWVEEEGRRHNFELNIERPNVVEQKLGVSADKHPLRRCGFQFEVPVFNKPFIFGFRVNGQLIKVLEGRWLTPQQIAEIERPRKTSVWQRFKP
ncbi:hypothetical protein [Salinivibrio sp. PR919]|uniref:hypothetical protein n=1 Tax=Salinivibrio sp. PR919 TaxID=1909491 RepID=UPI000986F9DC|nr:hypothetical protein [Salinivibrio sp. PR919]OOF13166.1 hypothetical protein BZG83_09375 [Salinivibrio sp. PR919]